MIDKVIQAKAPDSLNENGPPVIEKKQVPKKKRKNTSKEYVPKYRSGSYAIVMALYDVWGIESHKGYLSKKELQVAAQQYTDDSFSKDPTAGVHYSAWSSMATLTKKDLVKKWSNPAKYALTSTGVVLGGKLAAGLEHSDAGFVPDVTKFGEWELVLLVDDRERLDAVSSDDIVIQLAKSKVKAEMARLPVGDFLWVCRRIEEPTEASYVLDTIIERKVINDLAMSITDKRFIEQKYRLEQSQLPHMIYLVEGDAEQQTNLHEGSIGTAMASTEVQSGFFLLHTQNYDETIHFLISLSQCIFQSVSRQFVPLEERRYSTLCRSAVRSAEHTASHIVFGKQLQAIKGMSSHRAIAIMERFGSARALYGHFEALQLTDGPDIAWRSLANVQYMNKGLVPKPLGLATSRKVYRFFCDVSYRSNLRQ